MTALCNKKRINKALLNFLNGLTPMSEEYFKLAYKILEFEYGNIADPTDYIQLHEKIVNILRMSNEESIVDYAKENYQAAQIKAFNQDDRELGDIMSIVINSLREAQLATSGKHSSDSDDSDDGDIEDLHLKLQDQLENVLKTLSEISKGEEGNSYVIGINGMKFEISPYDPDTVDCDCPGCKLREVLRGVLGGK